jgi:hypothetical protein
VSRGSFTQPATPFTPVPQSTSSMSSSMVGSLTSSGVRTVPLPRDDLRLFSPHFSPVVSQPRTTTTTVRRSGASTTAAAFTTPKRDRRASTAGGSSIRRSAGPLQSPDQLYDDLDIHSAGGDEGPGISTPDTRNKWADIANKVQPGGVRPVPLPSTRGGSRTDDDTTSTSMYQAPSPTQLLRMPARARKPLPKGRKGRPAASSTNKSSKQQRAGSGDSRSGSSRKGSRDDDDNDETTKSSRKAKEDSADDITPSTPQKDTLRSINHDDDNEEDGSETKKKKASRAGGRRIGTELNDPYSDSPLVTTKKKKQKETTTVDYDLTDSKRSGPSTSTTSSLSLTETGGTRASPRKRKAATTTSSTDVNGDDDEKKDTDSKSTKRTQERKYKPRAQHRLEPGLFSVFPPPPIFVSNPYDYNCIEVEHEVLPDMEAKQRYSLHFSLIIAKWLIK